MRLLIDGIFFQINNTGIARVWRSIIPHLVNRGDMELFWLARGAEPTFDGVTSVPFPSYTLDRHTASDSLLIQRICDHFQIDVFSSTYYTSPISVPMVLMVYDMIPELFSFNLKQRPWMEKTAAISYAQRYLCISESTRRDLLAIHPEVAPERVGVAWCGIDGEVFKLRPEPEVKAFKKCYGLDRPYFLFVGSRVQHIGYKNSRLFFDAVVQLANPDFDVFCVGGEQEIEAQVLDSLPPGVACRRVELTDEELSTAYNGAIALVYPSLYEGFGLPVIEAMASGCPVITTRHGSLSEAAGEAACLIDGTSVQEMCAALERVREPVYRQQLRSSGLEHVKQFSWQRMADLFANAVHIVHAEALRGDYAEFFKEWSRLREIQASVDY